MRLNKLTKRAISFQKEFCTPKSTYQNGKFVSPWGCSNHGNSWTEMIKSATHDKYLQDYNHDQKVDSSIKSCLISPIKLDCAKIKGLDRDHFTWIGHSTCLIQTNGIYILTDPVWSDIVSPVPLLGPRRISQPPIQIEDVPCDIVVLSHNHYDHLDLPTARRIGNRALWVVPLKVKNILRGIGITNCIELDWWESRELKFPNHLYSSCTPTASATAARSHSSSSSDESHRRCQESSDKSVTVTCLPAKHWSARTLFDKNYTLWGSFSIVSSTGSYYFAGDTGYCPDLFKNIAKFMNASSSSSGGDGRPIDLALLPIGAYKPRRVHREVHCDPEEAVQIHRDLQTRRSLGIHWGVFNLAHDSGCEPAFELARCRSLAGLAPRDFLTTAPGECLGVEEDPGHDISQMFPLQLQRYLELNKSSNPNPSTAATTTPTAVLS